MKIKSDPHPELYGLDKVDKFAQGLAEKGRAASKSSSIATKIVSNGAAGLASLVTAPVGALVGAGVHARDSVSTKQRGTMLDDKHFVLEGSRLLKSVATVFGAALLGGTAAAIYDVSYFLFQGAWVAPQAAMQLGAIFGSSALVVGIAGKGMWRGAIDGVKATFGAIRIGGKKAEDFVGNLVGHDDKPRLEGPKVEPELAKPDDAAPKSRRRAQPQVKANAQRDSAPLKKTTTYR